MKKFLKVLWLTYAIAGAIWLTFSIYAAVSVNDEFNKEHVTGKITNIYQTEWNGIIDRIAIVKTSDRKGHVLTKPYFYLEKSGR
jgi:hypothetical protein